MGRSGPVPLRVASSYADAAIIAADRRPSDNGRLADALGFALRLRGRKRVHNADEIMSEIVAKRLVEYLERAGFVVMKRAPTVGGAALAPGFEGRLRRQPGTVARPARQSNPAACPPAA